MMRGGGRAPVSVLQAGCQRNAHVDAARMAMEGGAATGLDVHQSMGGCLGLVVEKPVVGPDACSSGGQFGFQQPTPPYARRASAERASAFMRSVTSSTVAKLPPTPPQNAHGTSTKRRRR